MTQGEFHTPDGIMQLTWCKCKVVSIYCLIEVGFVCPAEGEFHTQDGLM